MIGLIQRVKQAKVEVHGQTVGQIQQGILLLLGVEREDTRAKAERLCERVINYRIFSDDQDRMNLSLKQIGGEILVVSQFTLVADTRKGTRPSFSSAASPELGKALYEHFLTQVEKADIPLATGQFGADMQVSLLNDGPVTFHIQV